MPAYKRVLVKLSGEALMNEDSTISPEKLKHYGQQIRDIVEMDIEVGIVLGGGNIFRGMKGIGTVADRVKGDYMGMLATVINGLAFQSELENNGLTTRLFTAIRMEPVADYYNRAKVVQALNNKEVVIFTAGTGNPYFTTDTASALRAVEINADAILKGTKVDGVYSDDPQLNPQAHKYDQITFEEAYQKQLKIMDLTAFTMCSDNNLPIIVFDINQPGNLKRIISGENIGTLIKK
jgi:uridylate kinase